MSEVFSSYGRLNALVHARAAYDRPSRELGPGQVFIDLDDMKVDVDFVEQTNDQLSGCRVLLALMGGASSNRAPSRASSAGADACTDANEADIRDPCSRAIAIAAMLSAAHCRDWISASDQVMRPKPASSIAHDRCTTNIRMAPTTLPPRSSATAKLTSSGTALLMAWRSRHRNGTPWTGRM